MPLLWSVIHFLLLFSLIVPGINFVTIHVMMGLLLYLYMKLEVKWFVPLYGANLLVVLLIAGWKLGVLLLLFPLIFLPGAIVMGILYKRKWSAFRTVAAGAFTLVAEMLLALVSVRLTGYDPFQLMKDAMLDSLSVLPQEMVNKSALDAAFYTIQMVSPIMMLGIGFYYALITHGLSRLAFGKKDGTMPALPPMSRWRVPRITAVYFIAVMVLSMFVNQTNGSILAMVVLNLLPLLSVLLCIQALSFLAFLGLKYKWPRAVPWIALALIVLWNAGMYIAVFIGMLDLMFSLKERLTDKP